MKSVVFLLTQRHISGVRRQVGTAAGHRMRGVAEIFGRLEGF
jgi:hypothetical protein